MVFSDLLPVKNTSLPRMKKDSLKLNRLHFFLKADLPLTCSARNFFRLLDYIINYLSAVAVNSGWRVGRDPKRKLSMDLSMQQDQNSVFH